MRQRRPLWRAIKYYPMYPGQEIHLEYGGVVPGIASRAYGKGVDVYLQNLEDAGIECPDAVVATSGPGLKGVVLVGLNFSKSLSIGWNVHFEESIIWKDICCRHDHPDLEFPFLSVVVSGGHTTILSSQRTLANIRSSDH